MRSTVVLLTPKVDRSFTNDKGGDRLGEGTCAFQVNYHLIWATKYRRKVLLGSVEVRLLEVLKTIAIESGFQLLAARVHGVVISAKIEEFINRF